MISHPSTTLDNTSFFDPHQAKAKGLSTIVEHERKEKDRGDHRHHAVDAVVIGLCTREVQLAWEARERQADESGINTADEEQMERYRRDHRLAPPAPFGTIEELRKTVERAVFGDEEHSKPICHRPVKRKLVGALHEETLFGPVLDRSGKPTDKFSAKKSVLTLTPNHLRMPEGWDELEAKLHDGRTSVARKREIKQVLAAMPDPPPAKSGIVRDRALRNQIRRCLRAAKLDPDEFTATSLKHVVDGGALKHDSGVPIRTVVLLRTMSNPVLVDRKVPQHGTQGTTVDPNPGSRRAYVGGNNHHIEIRSRPSAKGQALWTGVLVSGFDATQRKLARLKAFRKAGVPKPAQFNARDQSGQFVMPKSERARWRPIIAQVEGDHPLVDRRDNDELGGAFVMSLSEGEMLWMMHKGSKEPGYFVVAKLDPPNRVVLVPHWDARAAGERKDAQGQIVPDSKRESFSVTPSDLMELGPNGEPHARKVRVSPLGKVTFLDRD